MRHPGVGGILGVLWLAGSIIVSAQSGLLYFNEEPLSSDVPVLQQGSDTLVPLETVAPLLGLEVSIVDGRVVLRGSGFRQAFDVDTFYLVDGIPYVSLDWICALASGEIHRLGGDVYVETRRAEILDVEAASDHVTVRLTRFAPFAISQVAQVGSDVAILNWSNSELSLPSQLIRVGEAGIQNVRVLQTGTGVTLSLTLETGTVLATEQSETGASYVVTLRVAEKATHESTIAPNGGMRVYEWRDEDEGLLLSYVYVESWRDRFRLVPMVPAGGYQAVAALESILQTNASVSGISVDCPEGGAMPACLVMGGIPYLVPDTPSEVLAIDLFGRWAVFSSLCSVSVKHAGQLIPLDGVNQPLGYGEIISYAPGYTGSIARGLPGSFLAVKIRDNRVVSVYQGPFVAADPSAVMVVASGEAMADLGSIELGDPIELTCSFPQGAGAYRHAITAGPQVMTNGVATGEDDQAAATGLVGGTALACDWQGGLYMLSFESQSADNEDEGTWNLIDLLQFLPTTLKDAVLLSSCPRNAIAYADGSGVFRLGSGNPIRMALGLIPVTP